jgi:hypothetical protein
MTSALPTEPGVPAWSVVSQSEQTIINAAGSPENVMQVVFVLANGVQGSVKVPLQAYNVDNVRAAIQAQAQLLYAVHTLTG